MLLLRPVERLFYNELRRPVLDDGPDASSGVGLHAVLATDLKVATLPALLATGVAVETAGTEMAAAAAGATE
jgi:hypothetical protein